MDKQVSKATDFSTTASAIFCGILVHKSTFEKDVSQVSCPICLFRNEITLERLSNFFSNFAIVSPDSY